MGLGIPCGVTRRAKRKEPRSKTKRSSCGTMHPVRRARLTANQFLFEVWGKSSNWALLLLSQAVAPLLHNHIARVQFPTTLLHIERGPSGGGGR